MVTKKATLKKVNYTERVGGSGSRKAAEPMKVAVPTKNSDLPPSGQAKVSTDRGTAALVAEKAAGKRIMEKAPEKKKEKKRPSEEAPGEQKKRARVEETREAETEVEGSEGPGAYDLTFTYSSQEHIRDNLRASADLLSRIPCHDDYEFPRLDDMAEKEAYQLFAGSAMEMITHANLLSLRYDRRVKSLREKLKDFPVIKAEVDKVAGLKAKLTEQSRLMDDLSRKAEEARQKARSAEEELEKVKVEVLV